MPRHKFPLPPLLDRQAVVNHSLARVRRRASSNNLPAAEFVLVAGGERGGETRVFGGEFG